MEWAARPFVRRHSCRCHTSVYKPAQSHTSLYTSPHLALAPIMTSAPHTQSVLIKNGIIVSGEEGAEPYKADLLVVDGVIDTIGEPGSITAEAARVIDAEGLFVSPGFIDMHAHSDLYLLSHPDHAPKITQGCTVRHPSPLALTPDRGRWAGRHLVRAGPE